MKRQMLAFFLATTIFFCFVNCVNAIPKTISYQGVVQTGDQYFTGTGYFRFALVDGGGTQYLWSNDGSYPPSGSVEIEVSDGLFEVVLGQLPMNDIGDDVFNLSETNLRVWFDDGVNGSQLLSPDQPLSSVAYSFKSADASTLEGHTAMEFVMAEDNDADTLDSIDSEQFLRSDTNDTMNGLLTITNGLSMTGGGLVLHEQFNSHLRMTLDHNGPGYSTIVNRWGNPENPGIVLGTARNDGAAFQVSSGIAIDENNLPADNGSARFYVGGNGYVGINTISPQCRFHLLESDSLGLEPGDFRELSRVQCNSGNSINLVTGAYRLNSMLSPGHTGTAFRIQRLVDVTKQGYIQIGSAYDDVSDFVSIGFADADYLHVNALGNVGIGTNIPQTKLHIQHGVVSIFNNNDPLFGDLGGTLLFGIADGSVNSATGGIFSGWQGQAIPTIGMYLTRDGARTGIRADYHGSVYIATNQLDRFKIDINGNIGVGNTSPTCRLDINGDMRVSGSIRDSNGSPGGAGQVLQSNGNSVTWADVSTGQDNDWVISGTEIYTNMSQVGIGTTSPSETLDVVGDIRGSRDLFLGDDLVAEDDVIAGDDVRASDDITAEDKVTGARIEATSEYICPSADVAEKLPVHPDYKHKDGGSFEPGTVVVITEDGIAPCSEVGDTSLAGVISSKPALKMASNTEGQYVALSGRVPCKIVGPVSAGDILTTSEIPGFAQKTTSPKACAVVGKALESFYGETGTIDIWVGGF